MRTRVSSIAILVVALLLASCGTTTTGKFIATPTSAATGGNAVDAKMSALLAPNVGKAQTVAGLQVRIATAEPDGGDLPQFGLDCGRHLVFAQPPTSIVGAADVQAIKDFLVSSPEDAAGEPMPGASIPSSLLWAAGSVPSDQDPPQCAAYLEVLNSGSQPVVIAGAGVTINEGPTVPTFHYNQLDVCSFGAEISQKSGCLPTCVVTGGDCGGAGSCGYEIDVMLSDDVQPGKRYQAALKTPTDPNDPNAPSNPRCPAPLLLNPGDATLITITVSPSTTSPTGIYRATPFVVTGDGTSLNYPDLVTQLVYVSASDFTCFGYHSGHFTPIQPHDGAKHRCI